MLNKMNHSKIAAKQYPDSKMGDEKLKFLLNFILSLSKKQRKKLFIELSKHDL